MAHMYQQQGQEVLFAAADTYRAAATEQLQKWGQRLGIDVISGDPGSDPGAVVYSASQAAVSRNMDVLIIDTSGRMHTNQNLMAELEKVCRVAKKVIPAAPSEVLLVLDATTGQNGLQQAKAFTNAVRLTGVVLAKLDTSARGGIALSVSSQLDLPIRYVGIGEGQNDLVPFDAQVYLDNLVLQQSDTGGSSLGTW
jgi:fused signal recognition particle receptor